jgi:hypothetical protein
VEYRGRKPGGNVQRCVGYSVCFRTRGGVLYKSHVIETVQESGGVINIGAKQNVGEGGKMGYIYSSSCDFFDGLGLFVIYHKTAQPSS